ncbi:hypothetical protein PILCRDRAFT_86774 [Piloderma croceum F 1598]|uniref:Uncharacterized protein n=1 Tax=Piloderma croceum (strain F 1598) TaxID=765440 RepID=A0A0C3C922_PILCF|nr:hypothetical protein PILCRDRAFT_86774 [Piloderma croceum F 1598]
MGFMSAKELSAAAFDIALSANAKTLASEHLLFIVQSLGGIVPRDKKGSARCINKKRSIYDDDMDDTTVSDIKKGPSHKPEGDNIHSEALYDPNFLPDHQGDYFRHVNAKPVQHNIHDMDDKLIALWEMYAKLCLGSLIQACTAG